MGSRRKRLALGRWFRIDGLPLGCEKLPTKDDRALLLILALAALLTRAGERIALLGSGQRPVDGSAGLSRFCDQLVAQDEEADDLPKTPSLPAHARVVMASDFFTPLDDLKMWLRGLAGRGARGHLLQVLDPAEEDLPFNGRVRFDDLEQTDSWALISNVDNVRSRYQRRVRAHIDGVAEISRSLGLASALHRTSSIRPSPSLLGALQCAGRHGERLAVLNLGLIGFTQPWLLALLVVLPALWWLLRITPPSPKLVRFPGRPILPRPRARGGNIGPHATLAPLPAPVSGLPSDPRARRADLESRSGGRRRWSAWSWWSMMAGRQRRAGPERVEAMERFTERAVRQNREVILVGTAPDPKEPFFQRFGASDALPSIASWQPKPWPGMRDLALERLEREELEDAQIIWLSDGVAKDADARMEAAGFATALRSSGSLSILAASDVDRAFLLRPPESDQSG